MEKQSNTLSLSLLEEAGYCTKTENGKQDTLMWQGGLKLPGLTIAWAELLKIHCRYLGKKKGWACHSRRRHGLSRKMLGRMLVHLV